MINIKAITGKLSSQTADTTVIYVHNKNIKTIASLFSFDKNLQKQVQNLVKTKELSDKKNQSVLLHTSSKLGHIQFVSIDDLKDIEYSVLSNTIAEASRNTLSIKSKTMTIVLDDTLEKATDPTQLGQSLAEGAVMGTYQLHTYKSEKQDKYPLKTIRILGTQKAALEKGITKGVHIGNAVNEARNLANAPANDLTPPAFVEQIKKTFGNLAGFKLEIIDQQKAKKLGMNALLGVGEGSIHGSYLACIHYKGTTQSKPVALVGKGVTFDTGGISIKPSKSMGDMKGDMGGAAAVFGAMVAVSKLKPKHPISAYIPLVENMPAHNAQRPGDIVKAMNGKTIEVLNTDAEGRLILADAICYAVSQKAKLIIDIATLTGAVCVALGSEASAIIGTAQKEMDHMKDISAITGDRLWQLPNYEEYLDYLKSDIADLSNCYEGRNAGTCTAAKFLEQFTDKTPWFHLDIASTMQSSKTKGVQVKGMTGSGVRNLTEFVLAL